MRSVLESRSKSVNPAPLSGSGPAWGATAETLRLSSALLGSVLGPRRWQVRSRRYRDLQPSTTLLTSRRSTGQPKASLPTEFPDSLTSPGPLWALFSRLFTRPWKLGLPRKSKQRTMEIGELGLGIRLRAGATTQDWLTRENEEV
jgi:hypothetical protein